MISPYLFSEQMINKFIIFIFILLYTVRYYQLLLYLQKIFFFVVMIKKPNIVNIRMELHKYSSKQSLALAQQSKINKKDHKEQTILKHINEVLKMSNEQKSRRRQNEQKLDKTNGFSNTRYNKQKQISISIEMLQSIETVLKLYLALKLEENTDTIEQHQLKAKAFVNMDTYKKRKEMIQQNNFTSQSKEEENIFIKHHRIKTKNQKCCQRVEGLQKEIGALTMKLHQKNGIIEQLCNKQKQLKNKFSAELNRLIRNEKLFQINQKHSSYIMNNDKDYLFNIMGKNIKNHKSTSNINSPKNINTVIKNPYYKEKDDKENQGMQFVINQKDVHNHTKVRTIFVRDNHVDHKNQSKEQNVKKNHATLNGSMQKYQKGCYKEKMNWKDKDSKDNLTSTLEPFRNSFKTFNASHESSVFKRYQLKQKDIFDRKGSFTLQKGYRKTDCETKKAKKMNTEQNEHSKDEIYIQSKEKPEDSSFI